MLRHLRAVRGYAGLKAHSTSDALRSHTHLYRDIDRRCDRAYITNAPVKDRAGGPAGCARRPARSPLTSRVRMCAMVAWRRWTAEVEVAKTGAPPVKHQAGFGREP